MIKIIIFIVIFFINSFAYATWTQINSWELNIQKVINTNILENKNNLVNNDYQKEYIDILEKTNQQLSLWHNPYWIMIWALWVLFTVLALFSTIIIYRQWKEYKDKLENDREEYKNKINILLEEYKNKIDKREKESIEIENKVSELITQYENNLKTSTNEQKENIQKAIDDLKIQKISLETNRDSVYVTPELINNYSSTSAYIFWKSYHKCSKCWFGFKLKYNWNNGLSLPSLTIFKNEIVTCPNCWNIDEI